MTGRRLLFLLPLGVFAAVAIWFAIGLTLDPGVVPSALIGRPVPAFSLPGLDGEEAALSTADFGGGEAVVVNVFASWCVPCRAEHPYLMRLAEEGVAVYGINYRNEPADARAWLDRLGNPYRRIGSDIDARASIEWGVYGVQETFVVGPDGTIRYKTVGPVTTPGQAEDLRAAIAGAAE